MTTRTVELRVEGTVDSRLEQAVESLEQDTDRLSASMRMAGRETNNLERMSNDASQGLERFRLQAFSLGDALEGLIPRLTRGNRALIGFIGGVAALGFAGVTATQRLRALDARLFEIQRLTRFSTEEAFRLNAALQSIGAPEQLIEGLPDFIRELNIRAVGGELEGLGERFVTLGREASTSAVAAIRLVEAFRDLSLELGPDEFTRLLDENLGGQGSELLNALLLRTERGELGEAFAGVRVSPDLVNSLDRATEVAGNLSNALDQLAVSTVELLGPFIEAVSNTAQFVAQSERLQDIFDVLGNVLVPALTAGVTLLGVRLVAAGLAATRAWLPWIAAITGAIALLDRSGLISAQGLAGQVLGFNPGQLLATPTPTGTRPALATQGSGTVDQSVTVNVTGVTDPVRAAQQVSRELELGAETQLAARN